MKLIGEDSLRAEIGEDEALVAVEKAFRSLPAGQVVQPPPLGMDLEEVRGGCSGRSHSWCGVEPSQSRRASTFAAQMKSFSVSPSTAWVV